MTIARSLQLLLVAETPTDLPTIEMSMREIASRLEHIDHDTPLYRRAHQQLNTLLDARDRAIATTGGRVKLP